MATRLQREVVQLLNEHGFTLERINKHHIYRSRGGTRLIVSPNRAAFKRQVRDIMAIVAKEEACVTTS